MAFPTVSSITNSAEDTEVGSHTVNMPATVDAGDLLVVILSLGWYGGTVGTPSGWTKKDDTNNGSTIRLASYIKDADGTEDGGTIEITVTENCQSVAQTYRIPASSWDGDIANVQVGTAATGTDELPNPPAVTPSWGSADNLFIAYEANDSLFGSANGVPTNYTNGTFNESGADNGSTCGLYTARRELAASTDNPGTFDIVNSVDWIAGTMVVKPAAAAGTTIPIFMNQYRLRRS